MKLREDPAKAREAARREYDKLSDYDKLDHAYVALSEAYGDRGRRIKMLEEALRELATFSSSTGAMRGIISRALKGTP